MIRRESKRKLRTEAHNPTDAAPLLGSGKIHRRKSRRRMTCPNPREINQALASITLGELNRSCTLDDLIEKCLRSFDLDGNLCTSDFMVNMTLTVHSWVVPSAELARRLLTLYQEASREKRPEHQLRICHFLRYWLLHYPEAFRVDLHLEEAVAEIWEVVKKEDQEAHCQLLDISNTRAYTWNRSLSYQSSPGCGKKRKVSLLFDHLDAGELANHLSYLEFKAFCRISYLDFQSYVLHGSVCGSPALERSIALCNSISQWVQVMILNRPTPQQRAEVFTKFIHVTQKLRLLQNFSTLMAVVGGLCHTAISRLKETHALLPSEVTKILSEMTELLSSCGNYGAYRRAYADCSGFKIPIVGVHLKDLVSLHEALPDRVDGGRLNLSKLQSLYEPARELRMLQQAEQPFQANKDLVHLLTLSLDLYYTDEEIYTLSYAREPRYPKSLPPTQFKPPVVVEWAPRVAPKPDRVTIRKHVQQMVESVFKNYDPEQRGSISQEDFETIATSFPFSFYGLERDREGPWSREELLEYFMRACAIFSKLGLGFLHNFHEATFMKPTFCDSCNGFLWGVSKQGYRCRDCGMVCHKQCKDQVEVECQRRFHSCSSDSGTPRPATPAPTPQPSSGSEEEAFPFPPGKEQSKSRRLLSASSPGSRLMKHACTQTEGLQPEPHGGVGGHGRTQKQLPEQLKELEEERDRLLLANQNLQRRNSELEKENRRLQGTTQAAQSEPSVMSSWKGWTACSSHEHPRPSRPERGQDEWQQGN
ncbi:LOW QUALITY PROTEIN: RAS guanyl-releasing protein 4 [Eublepharis macularius]|uniref:LOW QUALITY PROTEIN: RAS guanyl-releasing protein 4 n=1 Tax=Eublepharis macularius TaxID=481883 RepID=A0AA97LGL6_EUBMA|nr:LOW QUALITY PROTEIN: RAS guanyl-releasing protein 4 [Eublepharis macularius]